MARNAVLDRAALLLPMGLVDAIDESSGRVAQTRLRLLADELDEPKLPPVDLSPQALSKCLLAGDCSPTHLAHYEHTAAEQVCAAYLNILLTRAADWLQLRYPRILEPDYEDGNNAHALAILPRIGSEMLHSMFVEAVRLGTLPDKPPEPSEQADQWTATLQHGDDAIWRKSAKPWTRDSLPYIIRITYGFGVREDTLREAVDSAIAEAIAVGNVVKSIRKVGNPRDLELKMDRYLDYATWKREQPGPPFITPYLKEANAGRRPSRLGWSSTNDGHSAELQLLAARRNIEPSEDVPWLDWYLPDDAYFSNNSVSAVESALLVRPIMHDAREIPF